MKWDTSLFPKPAPNCSSRSSVNGAHRFAESARSAAIERGGILLTTNLPFEEWTTILQSERLTGALLDRLTHRVHILPIQEDSYRLAQSKKRGNPGAKESKQKQRKGGEQQ